MFLGGLERYRSAHAEMERYEFSTSAFVNNLLKVRVVERIWICIGRTVTEYKKDLQQHPPSILQVCARNLTFLPIAPIWPRELKFLQSVLIRVQRLTAVDGGTSVSPNTTCISANYTSKGKRDVHKFPDITAELLVHWSPCEEIESNGGDWVKFLNLQIVHNTYSFSASKWRYIAQNSTPANPDSSTAAIQ